MILAILQARMSSTRLPGKVLRPILGRPMLSYQINRVKQSKLIDKFVLATSDDASDIPLLELGKKLGIDVFQGSLDDVLSRFYYCAKKYHATHIVRLTGDCPLSDAAIIDQVITQHLAENADYSSNCHPATFADGFDVEVMTFNALELAYQQAKTQTMREHVTLYLAHHDHIKQSNLATEPDTSHYRVTVDCQDDFNVVTSIFSAMIQLNQDFNYEQVINWLNLNPEFSQLNQAQQRNEALSNDNHRS